MTPSETVNHTRLEAEYAVPTTSFALWVQRGSIPGAPVAAGEYSSVAMLGYPLRGPATVKNVLYPYSSDRFLAGYLRNYFRARPEKIGDRDAQAIEREQGNRQQERRDHVGRRQRD